MPTSMDGTGFRADIQGMRAIAVLVVVVFHVWPHALPGGYVGVDVFFVISGYLITGLLLREFERDGHISLAAFYARRIRRLLPAASSTLLAVAAAAWAWAATSEWRDIARELGASAAYVENLLLVQQAVDYLALDAAPSPLQHFWSLSVEEQFYIVWPLMMLAAGALARRSGWRVRGTFAATLSVVTALSLGYAIHLSVTNPVQGYFPTTTRVWELGVGGLLAIVGGGGVRRIARRFRDAAGWLGIAAILAAASIYSKRLPFPGYHALVPTLGAAAVLFATAARGSVLGRLLGCRPMQYVGGISYSLYLWHWPVVVFYPLAVDGDAHTLANGLLIVAISIGMAQLSRQLIEERFRHGRPGETWRPYLIAVALTLLVGAVAAALAAESGRRIREAMAELAHERTARPGARAIVAGAAWKDSADFIPRAEVARLDRGPAYGQPGTPRCFGNTTSEQLSFCHYGPQHAATKIVVVGDSHAVHWLPAFEAVSESEGWRVTGLTKSACAFTSVTVRFPSHTVDKPYTECAVWARKTLDWLVQTKPDLVVISQSPNHALPGTDVRRSQPAIADGLRGHAKVLQDAGIRLAVIAHTPWQKGDVPACMERRRSTISSCSTSEQQALVAASSTMAAAADPALRLMDMRRHFCIAGECPVVIGGVLVYRDAHHLTATYARTLAPALAVEIKNVLKR